MRESVSLPLRSSLASLLAPLVFLYVAPWGVANLTLTLATPTRASIVRPITSGAGRMPRGRPVCPPVPRMRPPPPPPRQRASRFWSLTSPPPMTHSLLHPPHHLTHAMRFAAFVLAALTVATGASGELGEEGRGRKEEEQRGQECARRANSGPIPLSPEVPPRGRAQCVRPLFTPCSAHGSLAQNVPGPTRWSRGAGHGLCGALVDAGVDWTSPRRCVGEGGGCV